MEIKKPFQIIGKAFLLIYNHIHTGWIISLNDFTNINHYYILVLPVSVVAPTVTITLFNVTVLNGNTGEITTV